MKPVAIAWIVAAIALAGAAGYGAYRAGVADGAKSAAAMQASASAAAPAQPGVPAPSGPPQKAGDVDPDTGKRVLYWHDPMVPGQRFDHPGKSPFMDMQLVPVFDEASGKSGVAIDAGLRQNLGVRTAEAVRGTLAGGLDAVGSVAWDERDVAVVQARSAGFVERVHVRAPFERVRRGAPLVDLYVPDWVAAQEEFLAVKRIAAQSGDASLAELVDAARQRMRLAGMRNDDILRVEAAGAVDARTTLAAPIGGVVAEVTVREGMTVTPGAPLYRLNGLSSVWVNAEIPEAAAVRVQPGVAVEIRAAGQEDAFDGRVATLLPEINAATRTLKARIVVANRGERLVPGMFVNVRVVERSAREAVLVPSEALIPTGRRTVVIVAGADGRFAPVEVTTGTERDGRTEVIRGLAAGQKVVVSGQFLIDSEASLRAALSRMDSAPAAAVHNDAAAPEAPAADPNAGHVHAPSTGSAK